MATSQADAAIDVPLPRQRNAAGDASEHRPQPREIAGMPVTVLTTDAELCASLAAAVMNDHPLSIAHRLEDATQFAASGRCPILITDQTLDSSELTRITAQLRSHDPALVIIAVGKREQEDALKNLVSSRAVDRFMLKPVTPVLTRLAIESVAREYRWRTAHTRTTGGLPRTPGVQPQALQPPKTPSARQEILRRSAFVQPSWVIVAAMAAAVAAVVGWILFQRLPDIDAPDAITENPVLPRNPADVGAADGIDRNAGQLVDNAAQLIAAGRFAEAVIALESVRRVSPGHPGLPSLEAQLRTALEAELLRAREASTPDPQLSGPPVSAPERPIEARATPQPVPDSAAAERAVRKSRERILLEANEAIALGQFETARQLMADAEDAGVPATELAALNTARILALAGTQQNLAKNDLLQPGAIETPLRDATPASVAPATEMPPIELKPAEPEPVEPRLIEPRLVKVVQPEYPGEARLRGIGGWVELSLGVTAAGDVIDPRVESSSMKHLFGRAALAAVKQWKYEPRAATDTDSTHRVRVRVQFQLDN